MANAGSFKKGEKRPGQGKRGPGKATLAAREAIAAFVEDNSDRLNRWLTEIEARDGPRAAFQCFMDVVEYHIPKLARTEVTGKDGGPVETVSRVELTALDDSSN